MLTSSAVTVYRAKKEPPGESAVRPCGRRWSRALGHVPPDQGRFRLRCSAGEIIAWRQERLYGIRYKQTFEALFVQFENGDFFYTLEANRHSVLYPAPGTMG